MLIVNVLALGPKCPVAAPQPALAKGQGADGYELPQLVYFNLDVALLG
jgi:hypothetical protein